MNTQPLAPARMPGASLADRRINATIATGSGTFVLGLAISAAFEPELRDLHFFQALIYVAVVAMTRRKSAMGFGDGLAVPVFWNALSVFVTGGMPAMAYGNSEHWCERGQTQHPDVLVSLFAFCRHLLIIIGCTVGFIRRPLARQWAQLLVGGVIALSYLITMVFVFGTP